MRLLLTVGLLVARSATAAPAHLIKCDDDKATLTFDAAQGPRGRAQLAWSYVDIDGKPGSGIATVASVVRGTEGWHITLEPTESTRKQPGADDHIILVDENKASTLVFLRIQPSGWGNCAVDVARLATLVPPVVVPRCTKAEVKKHWLPEALKWCEEKRAVPAAEELCDRQKGLIAAQSGLAAAITDLMLAFETQGRSTSRWQGVFAVPSTFADIEAKCEEVRHLANTCHNVQCVTVDTDIATDCATATVKMIEAMEN
jgi:hypothetical protein